MSDLSHLIMNQTAGVYILRDKDGAITYVGQSSNVAARISAHSKQKEFSSACILQCKKEHLNDIEAILIKAICPQENTKHGTPESSLLEGIFWVGEIPESVSKVRAKKEPLVKLDEPKRVESHRAVQARTSQLTSTSAPHRRIPTAAVRKICGNISDMTLWRWLDNEALNFPKPIYIGRRRYWREADVVAWLEGRPVEYEENGGGA